MGDFADMLAVLAANSAENAGRRKIAILCCLRNGVEAGKIRVTSGNPAALMAISERTHLASTAVWQNNQPIDLNAAKIAMDEAADWLGASGDQLLPDSLLRYLKGTVADPKTSTRLSEAVILKPTFMGMGVDLQKASEWLKDKQTLAKMRLNLHKAWQWLKGHP